MAWYLVKHRDCEQSFVFNTVSRHLLNGTVEDQEESVRIAGRLIDIRNADLPNSIECYPLYDVLFVRLTVVYYEGQANVNVTSSWIDLFTCM